MSSIKSTMPSRSSQRIAERKASATGAKGPKSKKGKSLRTAIIPKSTKPSTSKGRGRGRDLIAPTEVAQPGSPALLTTAQVPHSVSHPTTANPALQVGYNDPQFEDSESDEGDQLIPFTPQIFTYLTYFQKC